VSDGLRELEIVKDTVVDRDSGRMCEKLKQKVGERVRERERVSERERENKVF
jgi:hypothetical protein